MTQLRNQNHVLVYGKYQILQKEHPTVYAFNREREGEKWLIVLNFSETNSNFTTSELG